MSFNRFMVFPISTASRLIFVYFFFSSSPDFLGNQRTLRLREYMPFHAVSSGGRRLINRARAPVHVWAPENYVFLLLLVPSRGSHFNLSSFEQGGGQESNVGASRRNLPHVSFNLSRQCCFFPLLFVCFFAWANPSQRGSSAAPPRA